MKNIRIFCLKIFLFLVVRFSIHLNRRVFVMVHARAPSEKAFTLSIRNEFALKVSKLFSFRVDSFPEGRQNILTELSPLNVYPFILTSVYTDKPP